MKSKVVVSSVFAAMSFSALAAPVVVAHRGASGYLPEHTLEAKALAYGMRPDFIEQDVLMTKDNHLIVMHDLSLNRTTDVEQKFPTRARADGKYYAVDFTLEEIKSLNVTEGYNDERFPKEKSSFRVPTLEEEIELIQGLNKSLGYNIGLYTEIKSPWFHRKEGKDISLALLKTLKAYGYTNKNSNIYLQSFDPNELKRVNDELMPAMDMDLKLVQLLAYTSWNETFENKDGELTAYNYDWFYKPGAMQEVAKYADGVGPWYPMLVDEKSTKQNIIITPMTKEAQAAGLAVHPYTLRADKGKIPAYAQNFDQLLDIFYNQVKVDGVFTDFPDQAVSFIKKG